MSKIAITDYFDTPSENEIEILGDKVSASPNKDTEVLLVWHKEINAEYVVQFPKLRAVQRYGVGYDCLDVNYLNSKGIICCNNPDYGVDEVSDTAFAFIMAISRGIYRYDNMMRPIRESWQENILTDIKRSSDTTIGVIGAGRIGSSVILKSNSVGFKTAFYDPYKDSGYDKVLNGKRADTMEELLSISDIVSIHCPLSEETNGMIDDKFISSMKEGASLVNTARGGILLNTDLIHDALFNGKLNSVAIDVLPEEPPGDDNLFKIWKDQPEWLCGRLLINPHTAYYSQASYLEIRKKAAENALRLFKGERPNNILKND